MLRYISSVLPPAPLRSNLWQINGQDFLGNTPLHLAARIGPALRWSPLGWTQRAKSVTMSPYVFYKRIVNTILIYYIILHICGYAVPFQFGNVTLRLKHI